MTIITVQVGNDFRGFAILPAKESEQFEGLSSFSLLFDMERLRAIGSIGGKRPGFKSDP